MCVHIHTQCYIPFEPFYLSSWNFYWNKFPVQLFKTRWTSNWKQENVNLVVYGHIPSVLFIDKWLSEWLLWCSFPRSSVWWDFPPRNDQMAEFAFVVPFHHHLNLFAVEIWHQFALWWLCKHKHSFIVYFIQIAMRRWTVALYVLKSVISWWFASHFKL